MSPKRGGLNRGLDAIIPKKREKAAKDEKKSEESINTVKKSEYSEESTVVSSIKEAPAAKKAAAAATSAEDASAGERVQTLRISKVEPNRAQPRKFFDEEKIEELAASLKEHGIIQPLLVKAEGDHFEIIAGERRWRAAQKAGLKEVPVIIKDYTPREVMEISLIENLQREDLNPIEEAEAYEQLMQEYTLTQEEVAQRVSKSRSGVTNTLRLLRLPEEVRGKLIDGSLSEGCGRALLALPSEEAMVSMAERAVKDKMTVREVEKAVQKLTKPARTRTKTRDLTREAQLASLADQLKVKLGTRVSILEKSKNKGRIEIEFYSEDELERLLALLASVQEDGGR